MTALVPALEMLWEDGDPAEAVNRRFGFTSPDAAGDWLASTLDEHWGLEIDACERIVISADNALAWVSTRSDRMVAKWSVAPKRFGRLTALADLSAWLKEDQGLPVSAPIASRRGNLQVEVGGASMSLQREMAGDLLDPADLTQAQAAGKVLAQLHVSLAQYPRSSTLDLYDGSAPLNSRISDWLDADVKGVSAAARETLRRLVQDAPASPIPPQLVHGDFRSANVLWDDGRIAAVLDLEEARWDHPIDELARSAVLLGTRYRNWGPVTRETRLEFLNGYQAVRPLAPAEMAWWSILVLWYSLMMAPSVDEDPTGWSAAADAQVAELASLL